MVTNYPINPRVRAYGKARIDIAQRVKTAEDWEKFWRPPSNPFPFTWGDAWRQSIEYKVIDFAAEVGFFVDILGLQVNALHSSYAMFTSPGREFFFTVVPAINETDSTPPGALRLQFMLSDLLSTTRELEKRGILFDQLPEPIQPGSSLFIASFRTPNGMPVELWGNLASIASPIDKRKPDGDRDEEVVPGRGSPARTSRRPAYGTATGRRAGRTNSPSKRFRPSPNASASS
jgi:catechol 2,3-dioxygenase-like lactoylglutathione lyase family enzyme